MIEIKSLSGHGFDSLKNFHNPLARVFTPRPPSQQTSFEKHFFSAGASLRSQTSSSRGYAFQPKMWLKGLNESAALAMTWTGPIHSTGMSKVCKCRQFKYIRDSSISLLFLCGHWAPRSCLSKWIRMCKHCWGMCSEKTGLTEKISKCRDTPFPSSLGVQQSKPYREGWPSWDKTFAKKLRTSLTVLIFYMFFESFPSSKTINIFQ